jgi:hypothetical protein
VGGFILLLFLPIYIFIKTRIKNSYSTNFLSIVSFLVLYFIISIYVIPVLAKPYGREPLPVLNNEKLKPLNIMTCILNRHYVKHELGICIQDVATKINKKYPNTIINYLDANFPFYNGFPVLPHLSHNDGKKIDLAFLYTDKQGNETNNINPSLIGYGAYENPKKNECNTTNYCLNNGYWHYNILEKIISQNNKSKFIFDSNRTKELINLLTKDKNADKIFIEPYLKSRMKIKSDVIRFQGCHAIRHDDHIHFQLK